MICYKDMTFCGYYKDCVVGKLCYRALTDKVINDAEEFGLPNPDKFLKKPYCYKKIDI